MQKIGVPRAQADHTDTTLTHSTTLFSYSVSDLLNDVKNEFDDTFSENVYLELGTKRRQNEFSEYLLYSDRGNTSTSPWQILANALESAARNRTERELLQQYKDNVATLEEQEKTLRGLQKEIHDISFAKGPRDKARLEQLKTEAVSVRAEISEGDKRLLRLAASKPLRNLLERETARVTAETKAQDRATLKKYREETDAMEAAGLDTSEAAAKLRHWQGVQADFADKTGLVRQYEREQITVANPMKYGIMKAGPVSIYMNSSTDLYLYAKKIKPIEGYDDIVIHGSKFGFEIRDADDAWLQNYSVVEFCEIVKENPTYKARPIRLISCETGADGSVVAQGMADILGVEILAPTDIVWICPDGSLVVGPTEFDNTGGWKTFTPNNPQKG